MSEIHKRIPIQFDTFPRLALCLKITFFSKTSSGVKSYNWGPEGAGRGRMGAGSFLSIFYECLSYFAHFYFGGRRGQIFKINIYREGHGPSLFRAEGPCKYLGAGRGRKGPDGGRNFFTNFL